MVYPSRFKEFSDHLHYELYAICRVHGENIVGIHINVVELLLLHFISVQSWVMVYEFAASSSQCRFGGCDTRFSANCVDLSSEMVRSRVEGGRETGFPWNSMSDKCRT